MEFILTAGHGYLKITKNQLKQAYQKGFTPTIYSFCNRNKILLEEDVDAGGFLKIMYPEEEKRKEKVKTIKSKYQNDINRNKYASVASNLKEFEKQIDIFNLDSNKIWQFLTSDSGEEFKILGIQRKGQQGYIYEDSTGKNWLMPVTRVVKIQKEKS